MLFIESVQIIAVYLVPLSENALWVAAN